MLHTAGVLPDASVVTACRATRIGEGVGVMGDINRVQLDYAGPHGAAPATVVVKLPALAEANRQQGIALGMYEAEVRFYAELGARTRSGLPTVYEASIVSGSSEFVIVMEDLGHMSTVDQIVGMTLDQAGAAVRVLADIHAAWWGTVDSAALEWIPSMVHERIHVIDSMRPQMWPRFLGAFSDALPAGGLELGEAFSRSFLKLQQGFVTRPWTLVHQDYRVDNLLFGDPTNDEVVVLDWQTLARGPGGYDLAYLLGGSLPIEERRANERNLVAQYHRRLTGQGVDYTLGDVWDDYRYGHALGGLATLVFAGATLDLANERGRELVALATHRHFTAALDHECLQLMT